MPYKTDFPIMPHLDPKLNPDHPLNHVPKIVDDPYLPLGKREIERLQREAEAKALASYVPPHVSRSWETDPERAQHRQGILDLKLLPKMPNDLLDLVPSSKEVKLHPKKEDFRAFAVRRLHLGYNRFHASHGEPHFPSEEDDPNLPEPEYCWIMEYTERECNTIRRKIAQFMGEFPAVVDPQNPLFNEEISWRYDRRLYCRCRRRNKRCIRPSHIEIFQSNFELLP